ncbi:hypothetical protein ONO86_04410 [Micromonospora noduli]|nr:hypothetical protein ONO86_04410 [Micromonospora noduli]
MDENADRAQVPGQQPVPERDVEPLWPPDPGDRGAVPPWAAVAEQRGGPSSVTPPVTPPVAAPPIGRPPVPGQPGAAAQSPPAPSDYPSRTGGSSQARRVGEVCRSRWAANHYKHELLMQVVSRCI